MLSKLLSMCTCIVGGGGGELVLSMKVPSHF